VGVRVKDGHPAPSGVQGSPELHVVQGTNHGDGL